MWQHRRATSFVSQPLQSPAPNHNGWSVTKYSRRLPGLRFIPLRVGILVFLLVAVALISRASHITPPLIEKAQELLGSYNISALPRAAFQPPEPSLFRAPDSVDTFSTYKFRNTCNISSLDLHAPFSPLCEDRLSMLTAMTNGGRIGFDAPYMPRGCDMRWFTSEEVCEILGRFDRVVLVGDSFQRHIIGSLNVLLRKNLGYGAVTDWNFSDLERRECFCNEQFDVKSCSVQGIYKTADVLVHDPKSLSCTNSINVIMEEIVRHIVPVEELARLTDSIGHPTKKPKVFIFGHGLWSDLDLPKTVGWLETVVEAIESKLGKDWSGLFVTPSSAGKEKPDEWLRSQGNKKLMLYEEAVGLEAHKKGLEHLGTWNMSIQANKYDGVHLDMRGNLVKAMMVMNWLNLLE